MNNQMIGIGYLTMLFVVVSNSYATSLPEASSDSIHAYDAEVVDDHFTPVWLGPAFDEVEDWQPPWFPIPQPLPLPISEEELGGSGAKAGQALLHTPATGETRSLGYAPFPSGIQGGSGGASYTGMTHGDASENERGFSDLILVGSPSTFPRSTAGRVVVQFTDTDGNPWIFTGSAHMVDAETAVTAGHVVYMHSFVDSGGTTRVINDWFDWLTIAPGSHQGVDNWGIASATNVTAWTGWTQNEDWNWDVALLRVDRAVGMLGGWTGWRWGDNCNTVTGRTYNNHSYPGSSCGQNDDDGNPLHNGFDMYFSGGLFEACSGNELRFLTTPGCFTRVWGGMSGSGYYYIDGNGNRLVHAVVSNGAVDGTYADAVKFWEGVHNTLQNTFIPASRGTIFDLQSLYMRDTTGAQEPLVISAGDVLSNLQFTAVNPTNALGSGTRWFDVLLSSNSTISTLDTLLSSQSISPVLPAMSQATVNLSNVTIPIDTPTGNYWLGTRFETGSDGVDSNNDSSGWDALELTIYGVTDPAADGATPLEAIVYGGDTTSVLLEYSNNGAVTTTVDLEVRASTNQTISTSDPLIAVISSQSLAGTGSWSTEWVVEIPVSLPDGTYYLGLRIVNSTWDDAVTSNNTAASVATFTKESRPINNDCANAILISSGLTSFDTTNATTDGAVHGECQFDGATYNDVWFRYVAPMSGFLTATTCEQLGGSATFDTDIVMYLGSSCGSLTLLDCNDDDIANACGSSPDYHSTAIALVQAGDPIYIRVGAYSLNGFGSGDLNVSMQLANDDCTNAIDVPLGDTAFSTVDATTDGPQEYDCFLGGETSNDIWFTYSCPIDGNLTLSTCNQADFDTVLIVYTGPCTNRVVVGCNDDTLGCAPTSQVELPVSAGETYIIRVAGWIASSFGEGTLTLELNTGLLGDVNNDGFVDVTDLLLVVAAWSGSGLDGTDLDGDGVVAVGDILVLIANWT